MAVEVNGWRFERVLGGRAAGIVTARADDRPELDGPTFGETADELRTIWFFDDAQWDEQAEQFVGDPVGMQLLAIDRRFSRTEPVTATLMDGTVVTVRGVPG